MKRVFISQPMSGKSIEDIKKVRDEAAKEVSEILSEEIEVVDSLFETLPKGLNSIWYLGCAIKLLANADLAYFTRGWESYRGCKIEHTVCTEYGVKTMYQQKWMKEDLTS